MEARHGRRHCFYCEGKLTDRRQTRNAVVQMLEADVFKVTLLELHCAFRDENSSLRISPCSSMTEFGSHAVMSA